MPRSRWSRSAGICAPRCAMRSRATIARSAGGLRARSSSSAPSATTASCSCSQRCSAWRPPMPELAAGDRLGRYELERVIGRGALGIVFRARRDDGGIFAVKIMRSHLSEDPVFIRRFAREARHARSVSHPHLVPVTEAGQARSGHPYLVMPFVEGGTLAARIAEKGVLELSETITLTSQIAAALSALHAADLVHRDVKPANVMTSDRGAQVTDFGLARGRADTVLTRLGAAVGTPHYMAPELLLGQPATAASDIYSLAC